MIRKKGQTEDFIADLIPSLIIIAIGLYILADMEDVGKKSIEETNDKLLERLGDEKTMTDYLAKEIGIDNKKITLNELISLSYKNEQYQQKVEEELGWIIGQDTGRRTIESCNIITCLNAEIQYPDGSSKKLKKDIFCPGEEKAMFFPTYGGQSIKMIFQLGVTVTGFGCVG